MNWNVKEVNNEKMCFLVGFFKDLNAVFQVKVSQINTENEKKFKFFQFPKFLCFFSTFLKNYVDWNIEKDQQGKNLISSRRFRRVFCCFLSENVSNQHRKWQRTQNFSIFKDFMIFFVLSEFVELYVLKGQQGNGSLSSSLS